MLLKTARLTIVSKTCWTEKGPATYESCFILKSTLRSKNHTYTIYVLRHSSIQYGNPYVIPLYLPCRKVAQGIFVVWKNFPKHSSHFQSSSAQEFSLPFCQLPKKNLTISNHINGCRKGRATEDKWILLPTYFYKVFSFAKETWKINIIVHSKYHRTLRNVAFVKNKL